MKCDCNQLHCQFNRNRQLISRLNLEIFTQHHSALNHGCSGWVSSFIIICHGCVSGEAICPSAWVKSRWSNDKHIVCSEFSLCSS